MHKERLELFSDGVFAIILTLLVLDLKVPEAAGWAGLRAALPGLAVHAGAFYVIGMAWITHHQFLEHIESIGKSMLGWNLLILFWITLVPYGARIAAEHPTEGLGAAIMTGCISFSILSVTGMVSFGKFESGVLRDPRLIAFRRRRRIYFLLFCFVGLGIAALCFVTPWVGYAYLSLGGRALATKSVSETIAALEDGDVASVPEA